MPELVSNLYDLNMLYEQVSYDDSMLKRFIDIFLSTVPDDMGNLADALIANDLDRVRSAAHKMKSSYGLMGAEWAKDLCFEIETISKTGIETEKLPIIFGELSDKFTKMVALLQYVI
jgi:HPt (histidine-containing phosphotransfer) domain-containing protein